MTRNVRQVGPALLALLVLTGCSETANNTSVESRNFVDHYTAFSGATLIDGTGAPAIAQSVVLIKGDKIVSVGGSESIALPHSTDIVDVSGKWIVPGLIDAHTHFMESGRIYTNPGALDLTHLVPYEEEVAWIQGRVPVTLRSYLCAGVTSSMSAGGPRFEYEVRELASSTDHSPNVFIGHGPITTVPSDVLFPQFDGDTAVRSVAGPDAAIEAVRQGAEWGADFIKTGYLGGAFATNEEDYVEIHEAIVAEAKRHSLKVTTHVTEIEPARKLVEVGVDSLQHLPRDAALDQAFIDLAKRNSVIFVPTLAVSRRSYIQAIGGPYDLLEIERRCGDPDVIDSWHAVGEPSGLSPDTMDTTPSGAGIAAENARLLYDAGLPLAAGSDAGNIGLLHGASLHYELKLMGQIGIEESDLIVAATLNAARVAGQEKLVGSIEAGKLADLVILNADPLEDISNLQTIDSIVKSGRIFKQVDLLPRD